MGAVPDQPVDRARVAARGSTNSLRQLGQRLDVLAAIAAKATIRYHQQEATVKAEPNVAIGDAHVVAMPSGRDTLVAIGAQAKIGSLVDDSGTLMNRLQAQSAHRYLYARPGGIWSHSDRLNSLFD